MLSDCKWDFIRETGAKSSVSDLKWDFIRETGANDKSRSGPVQRFIIIQERSSRNI